MNLNRIFSALTLSALTLLSACGGGSDSTPEIPPTMTITASAPNPAVQVPPGAYDRIVAVLQVKTSDGLGHELASVTLGNASLADSAMDAWLESEGPSSLTTYGRLVKEHGKTVFYPSYNSTLGADTYTLHIRTSEAQGAYEVKLGEAVLKSPYERVSTSGSVSFTVKEIAGYERQTISTDSLAAIPTTSTSDPVTRTFTVSCPQANRSACRFMSLYFQGNAVATNTTANNGSFVPTSCQTETNGTVSCNLTTPDISPGETITISVTSVGQQETNILQLTNAYGHISYGPNLITVNPLMPSACNVWITSYLGCPGKG